jgi:sec-independent protein translocase protein TatC
MRNNKKPFDADDLFADTRMSFGDHIEELRTHLWRAIMGFLVCLVCSFYPIGEHVLRFIAAPVEAELKHFHAARAKKIEQRLRTGEDAGLAAINEPREIVIGLKGEDGNFHPTPIQIRPLDFALQTQEAVRLFARPETLATMSVTEAFVVYVKVSIVCALVIGSPWIFWQLWSFVAAGLYPHEKKYVHYYLPFSLGLFLAGVAVCEFVVIPQAIRALLVFNEWLGLEPDLRLNEWLSFAILMPLVFGLSFQTPLVMLFLAKIGIFTSESFRRKRRMAWFIMTIVAAVVVPSSDVFSVLGMLLPMCGLYELGILLARWSERSDAGDHDLDVPERGEMIEV